jgi:hypothetical protein
MANIITFDPKVGRFQMALARYRKLAGLPVDYEFSPEEMTNIQWSFLQLEGDVTKKGVLLQTKKGNVNTDNPDAILLDGNDIFIVTGEAYLLRRYTVDASAGNSYSNEPLMSYPSKRYFVGAKAGSTPEYKALMALFQGTRTLKIGNKTLVDTKSNLPFLKVPNAPYVETNDDYAEFDLEKAIVPLPSPITMFGTQDYTIVFEPGSSPDYDLVDGSVTAAGVTQNATRNQLVGILEGIRIIGGATVKLAID